MSLASLIVVTAVRCSFPGVASECKSTDGRVVAVWMMPDVNNPRELIWRDMATGSSGVLGTFERSIDLFWSPTGHRLAITDAAGSDNSDALVWQLLSGPRRSFEQDLRRVSSAADLMWKNDHQYFEVVKWVTSDRILVRAWGHGNPKGVMVDRLYSWTVSGSIRRVR